VKIVIEVDDLHAVCDVEGPEECPVVKEKTLVVSAYVKFFDCCKTINWHECNGGEQRRVLRRLIDQYRYELLCEREKKEYDKEEDL